MNEVIKFVDGSLYVFTHTLKFVINAFKSHSININLINLRIDFDICHIVIMTNLEQIIHIYVVFIFSFEILIVDVILIKQVNPFSNNQAIICKPFLIKRSNQKIVSVFHLNPYSVLMFKVVFNVVISVMFGIYCRNSVKIKSYLLKFYFEIVELILVHFNNHVKLKVEKYN